MGKLSTSDAADPAITTSEEDPARLAFEAGSAAFMINYPFVYPSAKENAPDIFKVMKAAKYPQVDPSLPSAPPLGGINLGVSAYSENQDLAFEAIQCLIKPENQIATAVAGGLPPVREDLYDSPEIKKAYPGFSDLIKQSIEDAARAPVRVAGLPGHLAGDPGGDPPDDRHRPERPGGHLRRAARPARGRDQQGGPAVRRSRQAAAATPLRSLLRAHCPGGAARRRTSRRSRTGPSPSASSPGCSARRR